MVWYGILEDDDKQLYIYKMRLVTNIEYIIIIYMICNFCNAVGICSCATVNNAKNLYWTITDTSILLNKIVYIHFHVMEMVQILVIHYIQIIMMDIKF